MTELEKMQRAKMYIDKLANGIDPITDLEVSDDSALNNVRLSRCFFYVSDILRQVIENGGSVKSAKHMKRAEFCLSAEAAKAFSFPSHPLRISEFVSRINELIDPGQMKKLTTTAITGWLVDRGFMEIQEAPDGNKHRLPTPQGKYIGLSTQMRNGQHGEYLAVLYNEDAQRFIMDNLEEILEAYRNRDKS